MGGAAPRPSTRAMVLCTWKRDSRVRCDPRQRRPGRAARAAGRRPRSLPDSLLFPIFGKETRFPPKKILTIINILVLSTIKRANDDCVRIRPFCVPAAGGHGIGAESSASQPPIQSEGRRRTRGRVLSELHK